MAPSRRSATTASPAATPQPNASSSAVQIKAEKSVQNKAKMEVEEEQSEEEEEEGENISPKGSKRVKIEPAKGAKASTSAARGNGAMHEDGDESDDAEEEEREEAVRREIQVVRGMALRDPKDGYIPGSVVKVRMENFLTYEKCEFTPGPHLNMIVGPNGTGKSTIVCAICLGLGSNPQILGRAKKISSFVKHGHSTAWVEIALKNHPGKPPLVVRRNMMSEGDRTTWKLNGETATMSKVTETVQSLNIQISNLCTFLPQDKVCEFAQMSPEELLKETQRCAGDPNLTSWHQKLIDDREEEKKLQSTVDHEQHDLSQNQAKNALLETEVKKYQEREDAQKAVDITELLIPFAYYQKSRDETMKLKEMKEKIQKEYETLARKQEPFLRKIETMAKEIEKEEEQHKKIISAVHKKQKDGMQIARDITKQENNCEDVRKNIQNLKHAEQETQNIVKKLRKEIADLEKKVANKPEDAADTSDLERQMEPLRAKLRKFKPTIEELNRGVEFLIERRKWANQKIEKAQKELADFQDVQQLRDMQCQQQDRNLFEAAKLVRLAREAGKFKGVVCDPIRLCTSVKDPKNQFMCRVAEGCVNYNMMKTFVCTDRDDYNELIKELNTKRGMRMNAVALPPGTSFEDPPPDEQQLERIKSYGFDCFAIDLFDAPLVVKAYLRMQNLGGMPVSFRRAANQLDTTRIDRELRIKRYLSQDQMFMVSWSAYGNREAQQSSYVTKKASIFTVSENPEFKAQREKTLMEAQADLEDIDRAMAEKKAEDMRIREEQAPIQEEFQSLVKEKDAREAAQKKWETAKNGLERKNKMLSDELSKPNTKVQREALGRKLQDVVTRRLKLAIQLKELLASGVDVMAKGQVLKHRIIQKQTNRQMIGDREGKQARKLKEKELEFKTAGKKYAASKDKTKQLVQQAQTDLEDAQPDVRAAVTQQQQALPSIETLEDRLEQENATLALTPEVSEVILHQYEERKRKIASLETRLAQSENTLHHLQGRLRKTRGKWEPALEALVQGISKKFDQAFQRMGCQGEVGINKYDDYAKWGIQIMVSFRDGDKLQALTGQRQSGGERSLSTILYLMSLTELSKSPFSLVDEINQGMDMRAERAVHNQLVEVTCHSDAGQYFLITPKLLPNLRYHSLMKILCINNGDWLPTDERTNLGDIVAAQLKKKRTGGV